jgi:hypothetical protein
MPAPKFMLGLLAVVAMKLEAPDAEWLKNHPPNPVPPPDPWVQLL